MRYLFLINLLLAVVATYGQSILSGHYLGQSPPADHPMIFAPGFISTENDEMFGTFSPDLKEFYFVRAGTLRWEIMSTKLIEGKWSTPSRVPFAGNYVSKFCLSPDGSMIFLTSLRSRDGRNTKGNTTTWYVKRSEGSWLEPQYLEGLDNAFAPSVCTNGNLYFHKVGESQQDIYYSEFAEGKYSVPIRLGREINSGNDEADPWIAPDESFILFSRQCNDSTMLFVSYRSVDNNWTEAIPLGNNINSISPLNAGSVSPDGKYIFLFSNTPSAIGGGIENIEKKEPGDIDIYWVSSGIIDRVRPGRCRVEKFAPGIISLKGRNEGNLSYSSAYNTYIYRVFEPGLKDPIRLVTYFKNNTLEVTSEKNEIDSEYKEWDFNFDRSGRQFYFTSDRPFHTHIRESQSFSKIWKASFTNGKWGNPFPLPSPVNQDSCFSGYPSFTREDKIYFHSNRGGGYGMDDIYSANSQKNSFTGLHNPGYPINTIYSDRDPAISPNDSMIVFFSDRPGGSFADGDLYLSVKGAKGQWRRPMPLGYLIGYAGHPYISDDGKILYFTLDIGDDTDICMAEIDELLLYFEKFLKYGSFSDGAILAPGNISTPECEVPLSFIGNNTLVLSRTPEGFADWRNEPVFYTKEILSGWTEPLRIPNKDSNWPENLELSPGIACITSSKAAYRDGDSNDFDIRITFFDQNGLATILDPAYPINTIYTDSWPTTDRVGNLFFFSDRPGGIGNLDIYTSLVSDMSITEPEILGYPVNTKYREHDPAISPDGTKLVFASDREGGFGGDDLYFCFRLDDGNWSPPFNAGETVNTEHDENRPVVCNTGRRVFFASNRAGNYNIYYQVEK